MDKRQVNFLNYRKWYDRLEVIYEMMRQVRNREIAVINPFKKQEAIRMIRINNAQQFTDVMKWINADKRPWNWYMSLASYKEGIPLQTFNMEQRDNKEWNSTHWKSIDNFDFLIDFDCDDHDGVSFCQQDVLAVSALLNTVPHSVRYSGMGYHIMVPGQYMPKATYDPDAKNNYFDMLRDILVSLKRNHSDFIDTGCHDPRRVAKIPYSLALYEDDNYVCWPMRTVREIGGLKSINYLSSAVLCDMEPMRNRGVPLLNMEKKASLEPFKAVLGAKWKRYQHGN